MRLRFLIPLGFSLLLLCGPRLCAQTAPAKAPSEGTTQTTNADAANTNAPSHAGMLVDQVIAVVNGDLILESDVDEERRFAAFQPLRENGGSFSRDEAIARLIDRALILQQARAQPDAAVTIEQAQEQLKTLRKDIPACAQFACETEAGWAKFVTAQGFTVPELEEMWRQRMQILKFVESRFQAGIRITPAEIKTYYEKTLIPQYRGQKAAAPPLESISDRIQEILLQQRVTDLLGDWLKTLKAEGTVRVMKPGEVAP